MSSMRESQEKECVELRKLDQSKRMDMDGKTELAKWTAEKSAAIKAY